MFTVGSCTVLYNPNESVLTNLNSYSNCVDISVVVDNSDTKNEISQLLKNDPNFIYIDMDGNKGIAAALNKGIEYLNSKNILLVNVTSNSDDALYTDYTICLYNGIIAIDGKSINVFKEEKLLKRIGISLPFMIDLSIQLQLYGLIDKCYLSKEKMVKQLWK